MPGVLCALLAEFSGKVFHYGNISNETRVIENCHNQLIMVSLIGLSYSMLPVHFHTLNNRVSLGEETVETGP